MQIMKTGWAVRLVAIVLVLLSCGATFADCFGSCEEDCDYCGMCPYACCCALVQNHSVELSTTITLIVHDNGVLVPHLTGTDIFRPPKASA